MSEKQTKRYVRLIKRNKIKIIKEFIKTIQEYGFFDRVRFAWRIIIAK